MDIRIDNPGKMMCGKVSFSNTSSAWEEGFDLLVSLTLQLEAEGFAVDRRDSWVHVPRFGLNPAPRLVGMDLLDSGGVHTVTTLEFRHPRIFPQGLFEYQHATGDDVVSSLSNGFSQWVNTDLFAIIDAVDQDEQRCTRMEFKLPERRDRPETVRRIILGPVSRVGTQQAKDTFHDEHSPQCPCCLLTNTWPAFRDILEGSDTVGIRFYGLRDQDGKPGADCRVNGLDHPEGIKVLRDYVSTWSGDGFEARKQYVLVTTAG